MALTFLGEKKKPTSLMFTRKLNNLGSYMCLFTPFLSQNSPGCEPKAIQSVGQSSPFQPHFGPAVLIPSILWFTPIPCPNEHTIKMFWFFLPNSQVMRTAEIQPPSLDLTYLWT